MNKKILLVMLAVALVFGMTACKKPESTVPVLTDFTLMTRANARDEIGWGIKGNNPGKNIKEYRFTVKQGATVTFEFTRADSITGDPFTFFAGYMPASTFTAGDYTVEIYAVDTEGNESNTLTVSFTIT
jgi:hypothetical protein